MTFLFESQLLFWENPAWAELSLEGCAGTVQPESSAEGLGFAGAVAFLPCPSSYFLQIAVL